MKTSLRFIPIMLAVIAACVYLCVALPAYADVAPPNQPPGSNITPGANTTNVAMASEYVLIEIEARKPITGTRDNLSGNIAQARVTATFTMTNRGGKAEKMAVRFPLGNPSGESDGFFEYPEVRSFKASVDGKPARSKTVRQPGTGGANRSDAEDVNWAAFDVSFAPKKDVVIQVSYVLSATGYQPEASFYYILETGAGWRDKIGQADIVVRLPYTATAENFFPESNRTGTKAPALKFVGNEARWQFKNMEPTEKDNLLFTVLAPSVWQNVLSGQAATKAKPNDGQAWLALARAYRSAVFVKYEPSANTAQFVAPTTAAYEKAATLLPKSAEVQVEFATALTSLRPNPAGIPEQADLDNMTKVIDLLEAALTLDNKNADAREAIQLAARDLEYWVRNVDGDLAEKTETLRIRVTKILAREGIAVG